MAEPGKAASARAAASARKSGPKRSEASRIAILEAARAELIEHGWRGFSADRLAKRAKASKQTIYRWWPSIGAIAVESALTRLEAFKPAGQAAPTLQARLEGLLAPLVSLARSGDGAHLLRAAFIAAADDAEGGSVFREWYAANMRKALRGILAEAATRGQVRRDYDLDAACEDMFGPLWHRVVILRGPLPETLVARTAKDLIAGLAPEKS